MYIMLRTNGDYGCQGNVRTWKSLEEAISALVVDLISCMEQLNDAIDLTIIHNLIWS